MGDTETLIGYTDVGSISEDEGIHQRGCWTAGAAGGEGGDAEPAAHITGCGERNFFFKARKAFAFFPTFGHLVQ